VRGPEIFDTRLIWGSGGGKAIFTNFQNMKQFKAYLDLNFCFETYSENGWKS